MFNWLKTKPVSENGSITDTLFGDYPLQTWTSFAEKSAAFEPWSTFLHAKSLLDRNEKTGAMEAFQKIVDTPALESRFYLQAWMFLREEGIHPAPEIGKQVLGVVVEVAMDIGLDTVAAYADHHARYYNYSGAAVIWERPDASLDSAIDNLLLAGARTIAAIGAWDKPRLPSPPKGQVRISMLSPGGLHFGQGPLNILSKDALGGPVVTQAFHLMQQLMQLPRDQTPSAATL
jgi:hypothetical protein